MSQSALQVFSSSSMSVTILGNIYDIETTTKLDLSNKGLTSIPVEIFNLTNLKILYLHNNELTSIPVEIGILTNLKILYLYYNKLTTIPAEIGNLTNLNYLYLYNNKLTSIPVEIGNLINLRELNLYENKLKSIPKEILKIKNTLSITATSYDIDNLDLDTEILIFTQLNSKLTNLSVSLKEIYLHNSIKDYDIKMPFGCEIKFFLKCNLLLRKIENIIISLEKI